MSNYKRQNIENVFAIVEVEDRRFPAAREMIPRIASTFTFYKSGTDYRCVG